MLTQHEWVEGCYAYYAENDYEPGNPEDGEWEDAHYPVPKCKGGEVTIKLLKQHHAVQGVLQSEEYQHPCIYGWEANYLEGEMLALCKKWRAEQGYRSRAAMTAQERSEISRRARLTQLATLTPEQLSERARKGAAAKTPQQRSEAARKANAAYLASTTPEQRSETARKREAAKRLAREAAMLQNVTEA